MANKWANVTEEERVSQMAQNANVVSDRAAFLYAVHLRERDGFWSEGMREKCLAYVAEHAKLSPLRQQNLWQTKGITLHEELKVDFKKTLAERMAQNDKA